MKEYIPTNLRRAKPKSREVMYAIGQDDGKGGYGMWEGPNPSEKEMLETIGQDNNSVIIRFNANHTDEVIWWWRNDRWIEQGN